MDSDKTITYEKVLVWKYINIYEVLQMFDRGIRFLPPNKKQKLVINWEICSITLPKE